VGTIILTTFVLFALVASTMSCLSKIENSGHLL